MTLGGRCGGGGQAARSAQANDFSAIFGPIRFVFPVQSWHLMAIFGDTCGRLTRSRKGKITEL